MRAPITFAYRNVVFGLGGEPWALYRLAPAPYPGLDADGKRAVFGQLAAWASGIERDFQLLRVSEGWQVERYLEAADGIFDPVHGHDGEWDRLLGLHRDALAEQAVAVPRAFVAVRIAADPPGLGRRLLAAVESLTGVAGAVRDVLVKPAAGLSQRQLDALMAQERRLFDRTTAFLDAERASSAEIEWLVRRAFCRGVGEPVVDGVGPQALVFASEDDELRYVPLERDVLRMVDSPIAVGRRGLVVDCERGESHQALLAFGALPEVAAFPGRHAELLFAPLDAVEFPVDASLCAQFVANRDAVALARRKIVDADNVYGEESRGDHGPSLSSAERPEIARELEDYLSSPGPAAAARGVASGAVDRVRRVVGVGGAVVVGVDAVGGPGGGHELHVADRAGAGWAHVGAEAGLVLVDGGEDRRAAVAEAVAAGGGDVERLVAGRDVGGRAVGVADRADGPPPAPRPSPPARKASTAPAPSAGSSPSPATRIRAASSQAPSLSPTPADADAT